MRIDKWLWCVRVYKTRTMAADAVRMNRVTVGAGDAGGTGGTAGMWVKPSHEVRVGDTVGVRKGHITFTFRVLDTPGGRQPAKEVARYAENITPREELDKLTVPRETVFISRDRGTGRPTKKERRDIEALMGDLMIEEIED
jgi:ribosome-associated heat shock protein Hsp15